MSELASAAEVHQKLCQFLTGPGGYCRLGHEAGGHCTMEQPSVCPDKERPTPEQSRAWQKRWAKGAT